MFEKKFLTQDGRFISAVCYGTQDFSSATLKIVCLHGWLDNASTFDLLIPNLIKNLSTTTGNSVKDEKDVSIICFDIAGHGCSEHREDHVYNFVEHVGDLYFILSKELKWEKYILLGHSLGSHICSIIAGTFPKQCEKLVLIEGIGPWTPPASDAVSTLRRSLLKKRSLEKDKKIFQTIEDAAKRRAEGNVINKLPIEAARILCRRGLKKNGDGYSWASDGGCLVPSKSRFTEAQVFSFLSNIQSKTLLILVNDGLFHKRFPSIVFLFGKPFSFLGSIWVEFLYYLYKYIFMPVISIFIDTKKLKMLEIGLWYVKNFKSKVRSVDTTIMKIEYLEEGGHHPHLTKPKEVSNMITSFLSK